MAGTCGVGGSHHPPSDQAFPPLVPDQLHLPLQLVFDVLVQVRLQLLCSRTPVSTLCPDSGPVRGRRGPAGLPSSLWSSTRMISCSRWVGVRSRTLWTVLSRAENASLKKQITTLAAGRAGG